MTCSPEMYKVSDDVLGFQTEYGKQFFFFQLAKAFIALPSVQL